MVHEVFGEIVEHEPTIDLPSVIKSAIGVGYRQQSVAAKGQIRLFGR